MDVLEQLDRATAWTATKVAGTRPDQLGDPTPCDEWDVRMLINHLLEVLEMFDGLTRGGTLRPPHNPLDLVGDDPAAQYEPARRSALARFGEPGMLATPVSWMGGEIPLEQALATLFGDQLIHGWDLATATGQDATMPQELVAIASENSGGIPDFVRGSIFAREVAVPEVASPQDKLIAYTGRTP